jgi:hypothetical protein
LAAAVVVNVLGAAAVAPKGTTWRNTTVSPIFTGCFHTSPEISSVSVWMACLRIWPLMRPIRCAGEA